MHRWSHLIARLPLSSAAAWLPGQIHARHLDSDFGYVGDPVESFTIALYDGSVITKCTGRNVRQTMPDRDSGKDPEGGKATWDEQSLRAGAG
jgi:hypothetical protein